MSTLEYKCLSKQVFYKGGYSLVPIRMDDRYDIMKWRNEQIFHLRQSSPLTKADQDHYFSNVVVSLFDKEFPDQVLFSFLKDESCIGYGGLVHIDWTNHHAEVSFIMNTMLEKAHFVELWSIYLTLIGEVAFKGLNLNKIYTYAYDLRPHLYPVLMDSGMKQEARLKEHILIGDRYFDVLIHSKLKTDVP